MLMIIGASVCDDNDCYSCEHYDGSDCRNSEKQMEMSKATYTFVEETE